MMRSVAVWAACGLLALVSAAGPAPAAGRDTLVIGVAQFPSSLHPDIDAEVIKTYALGFAIRQITAYDAAWKNSCLICAELPTIDNGLARIEQRPDGSTGMAVTIRLRDGLAWADGTKVTARDIAFTWRVGSDPKSGFSNPHPWNRADKVDVVEETTAVLHLGRVLASYNEWDTILPEHIEGPIYESSAAAGDYIRQTAYARTPIEAGLYDGPYRVASYQSGAQIVLEPNPYWNGPKPGFRRIVIRYIDNTAALQANLLSGDVDMVAGEGVGLTIDQAIALKEQYPDRFDYIFKPSLTYEHIDAKKENPILADLRVRQALLHAADRRTLAAKLFGGLQPVADTFVNPLSGHHTDDVTTYPYDPARAKALLAQAGWKPGPDGICRNEKGDRLSVEFATTAGNRLRELQQQVLQSNWKASCVEVRIRNEPARTFFGETLKQRRYGGLAMYAWTSAVSESPRRTLGSDNIPSEANGFGGNNSVAFSNPRMDALIDAVEGALDTDKRKVLWAEIQQIYARELPALPLFFRADPHVVPKWLKGYAPTGHGDFSSFWAESWHAEE